LTLEEPFNSPVDDIDVEFIKQNQKLYSGKISKKGGPYSKAQRDQRRQEVYRLHFEYGYSAKKIAELMKVNRNTINNDIKFLYSKLKKNWDELDVESLIMKQILRMEDQRTRILEQLDKTQSLELQLSRENNHGYR
jgi:DNA-binding NarL/FixJ family response regulator